MRNALLQLLLLMLAVHSPAAFARTLPRDAQMTARSANDNTVYETWTDNSRHRQIPVKIYLPPNATPPYPIVIFSHGLGGSRDAAEYLGQYWSQHGYFCVFPQHVGSDSSVWEPARGTNRQEFIRRMQVAANGQNLVDRAHDVTFVIDELERRNQTDPNLKGKLNLNAIAVAGHSFGAGTALVAAGQKFGPGSQLEDKRVKSALYLCPPVMGGRMAGTYDDITIPGMLLTGTEDNSMIRGTKAEDRRIPYDGIRAPHQYLVNFYGADHATFGGRSFRAPKETDAEFHRLIDGVTLKFLDATLKNDPAAWQWLDGKGLTDFLGKTAAYERK